MKLSKYKKAKIKWVRRNVYKWEFSDNTSLGYSEIYYERDGWTIRFGYNKDKMEQLIYHAEKLGFSRGFWFCRNLWLKNRKEFLFRYVRKVYFNK